MGLRRVVQYKPPDQFDRTRAGRLRAGHTRKEQFWRRVGGLAARGRWEGDTLVVDTTSFKDRWYRGSDENLHLIERFTMADANTILYRFTADDPTALYQVLDRGGPDAPGRGTDDRIRLQ